MPTPILSTKLFIPSSGHNLIHRERLFKILNKGLAGKLTLISAPAGFGKTTVVSQWITNCGRPAGWISLEKEDENSVRFLSYVIAALQKVKDNTGEGIQAMLQSPQPPSTESILTILLNEINTFPENFILVLDDYHLIDSHSVDKVISFLLEHLPPQMHMVLVSREDPNLPFSRMRARGQLTELRASDLRFTPEEIRGLLIEKMSLNLSAGEIDALENRTEGWITGLQLAAISLQSLSDTSSFISSFTGSHHFILDYLLEEVLEHQSEEINNFLLSTSIADRLCGSLCDALVPHSSASGQETLKYLQQVNLFLISLDHERIWFRYHHLFGDLLKQRLSSSKTKSEVQQLHLRASIWYEKNHYFAEAVDHALMADDSDRTADLVELAWPDMEGTFQSAKWLEWIAELPEPLIKQRPVLCAAYAMALMDVGKSENVDKWLNISGKWLDNDTEKGKMIIRDDKQFQSLPATIASTRSYLAQITGDLENSIKYARLCVKLADKENYQLIAGASSLIGISCWAVGDLEKALLYFHESIEGMKKAGNILFAIAMTNASADIAYEKGCLKEASDIYNKALKMADDLKGKNLWVTANSHLGLTKLFLEWGDAEAAEESLQKSRELCKYASLENTPYLTALTEAALMEYLGDLEKADKLLNKAKELYMINPAPDVRPIDVFQTCLWIRRGKLKEAASRLEIKDYSNEEKIPFLRCFDYIAHIRLLMAEYQKKPDNDCFHKIIRFIEKIKNATENGGWQTLRMETLILESVAYELYNNREKAFSSLRSLIPLTESEGFIRIFTIEGQIMKKLLTAYAAQQKKSDYIIRLLSALDNEKKTPANQPLLEPLSPRELEILRFISEGLSNREIGERLFLALTTIKGYNQRLFAKLNVQRRTEAVARARKLGIL